MRIRFDRYFGFFFAPDEEVGGGTDKGNTNKDDAADDKDVGKVTWTPAQQKEIDRIVTERLDRDGKKARKDIEADVRAEIKADADKAAMTESERLKADKEKADFDAKEAKTKADARIIRAEAKVQALALGVKPERLDYVLKMVDLSPVKIGEDDEPDVEAIKKIIDAVLTEIPELKGSGEPGKGGADFSQGKGAGEPLTEEIIASMSPEDLKKRMPEVTAFFKKKGG